MSITHIRFNGDALAALRNLPEHCQEGLRAYFEERRPVGSFLHALLANDMLDTYASADSENLSRIYDYVQWLYSYAPSRAYNIWGSPEAVDRWLNPTTEEQE